MKNWMLPLTMAAALMFSSCAQPPAPANDPTPKSMATASSPEATQTPAETPSESSASEDGKARAEELLAAREKDQIPYQELDKKENGPAFLYLLETQEDKKVLEQALRGIAKTYTGDERYADKKNLAGERYTAVVLKYLDSEDKRLLAHSLEASGTLLGAPEPNREVVDKVISIASDHKELGAREKAIDTLYKFKDRDQDPAAMAAFLKALSDEPAVASSALFRLNSGSNSPVNKAELLAKLEELLKHKDPGVRGRALLVMERLTDRDKKAELQAKFTPFLKDGNPYVRSSAIKALASTRDTKVIPTLMTLIDDKEKNTYDIRFEGLLGNDSVHHDGSAWSRVDDSVLTALDSMTGALKDNRFKKGRYKGKTLDQDIAADVKKAKEWFEANKAAL